MQYSLTMASFSRGRLLKLSSSTWSRYVTMRPAQCHSLSTASSPCRRAINTSSLCHHRDLPELTSKRYPLIKRKDFAKVTDEDVGYFRSVLGGDVRVLTEDLEGYNADWLGIVRGASQLVLKPKTTSEVSEILKYCNKRHLAVVPQGGNTGMVGGSVPVFDEIVLSTQLMNKVISLDEAAGIMVCESGCVLETLDSYLADFNLMMPLDLGAKGSCHIGGNVATNAGGIRFLRYGSLHGSVLGVEAVMADGQVVDCLTSLRKDNTGYDLKQLFIGSEGTLGVVTAVSILCPQRPTAVNLAFLGCSSFDKVLSTLREARSHLGEILSAFEMFDNGCMECNKHNLHASSPLDEHPFYVVLETSGSNDRHDEEKLTDFLETVMGSGTIDDGLVVSEPSKVKTLWALREQISEGLLLDGYCFKYDFSLPLTHYYRMVEDVRDRLAGQATRVVGFGHVGDGNLHLNITAPKYSKELHSLIEPFVYEYIAKLRGSISAEHGLGFVKNKYIHHSRTTEAINLMKQLKTMMDPKGILNPYKTLPVE